ncbi:MAG: hypothetical protein R3D00_25040 [Bacteroidia bacterium]
MNYFLILVRNDIRNIFRDKVLIIFCFLPVIMAVLMRFGFPLTVNYFPLIKDYRLYVLAILCLVSVTGPAFLSSMIMLDEKDENLFTVLRVMPVSSGTFILFRLLFITLLGFFASWVTIVFSETAGVNFFNAVLLSLQTGLTAPLITLLCITLARNKVEGVTFLKGLNFLSMLPLVFIFAVPDWEYAGGIIPFYWVYKAFGSIEIFTKMIVYSGIGVSVNLLFISWLYKKFQSI